MHSDIDRNHILDSALPFSPASNPEASLSELKAIRDHLSREHASILKNREGLVFVHPPDLHSRPAHEHDPEELAPRTVNTGPFALDLNASENSEVLIYEDWLFASMESVETLRPVGDSMVFVQSQALLSALEAAYLEVERWKSNEWERRRCTISSALPAIPAEMQGQKDIDITRFLEPRLLRYESGVLVAYLLVAVLHLLCSVSIQHTGFAMTCLSAILASNHGQTKQLPADVRNVLKSLELEPKTEQFVCCPRCFSLYPIDQHNRFQSICTYRPVDDIPACGAALYATRKVKGSHKQYPARKFILHDFHDWLGRLLSRPGMEKLMDKAVKNSSPIGRGDAGDLWDAPVLHTVKLSDGRPFLDITTDEGRFVFSVCTDGFNPHGKGGPAVSVGSIFFVCLNLPPHIRYKYENMYLAGVIPGPKHPSREQMDNIMVTVLKPLRLSYEHGVRYHRTPSHPQGRKTFSIVVPLVADTLALHQMNGNAPHTHTRFCPFCLLCLDDIEDLDHHCWPRRTKDEHIAIANQWLEAKTSAERNAIYNETGIRWSAFLTLPYWDPIKFLAIDIMHALFLGLFRHLLVNVWGMDSEKEDGLDGIANDPTKRKPTTAEMSEAKRMLRHEALEDVGLLRLDVLRQLARFLGIERWRSKKKKILKRLEVYRVERHWFTADGQYIPLDSEAPDTGGKARSVDRTLVKQALLDINTKTRAGLKKHLNPTLAGVCAEILDSQLETYLDLRKDALLDLIDNYRKEKNIIDEQGQLLPKPKSVAPVQEQDKHPVRKGRLRIGDVSEEEYQLGLTTLRTGSKTELGKLAHAVLVLLCSRNVGPDDVDEWKKHNKEFLLDTLRTYRIGQGIPDSSRKSLAPRGSSTQPDDAIIVTQEEIDQADEALNYWSKTKLKTISPIVWSKLLATKLRINVEAKRAPVTIELDKYRRKAGITDDRNRVVLDRRQKLRNRVLGKKTLIRIWDDMKLQITPSWLTKVPPTVGTRGEGSIGADGYRTFCTVNLPVTLIAMWGMKPKESRQRQLLDNFMDLVIAVKAVSMRLTTAERRETFRVYLLSHLRTLLKLFPGTNLVSNQHKALHLPEVLEFLGPAHALWCYGFERGNYELQQINTNNRIYELASTLFHRFCYKQNLRHLFHEANLPAPLRHIITSFSKAFESRTRGSLFDDSMVPDGQDATAPEFWYDGIQDQFDDVKITHDGGKDLLDKDVELVLQDHISKHGNVPIDRPFNRHVTRLKTCTEGGDVYKTANVSFGDSHVIFQLDGDPKHHWRAGRIRDIFIHSSRADDQRMTQIYMAVDEYMPVAKEIADVDPYRRYGSAGGYLFQPHFFDTPRVVSKSGILCHFALSKPTIDDFVDAAYIHVLPLNKW